MFNLIPGATDAYWDVTTIRYYSRYVSDNVFAPAGVASTLEHPADQALAYPFPPSASGWDSGDLSTMSGCIGWHLSVDDLLRVMAAFAAAASSSTRPGPRRCWTGSSAWT